MLRDLSWPGLDWDEGTSLLCYISIEILAKECTVLDLLSPNFTSGVNFAVAGASLLPEFFPVTLNAQVRQITL